MYMYIKKAVVTNDDDDLHISILIYFVISFIILPRTSKVAPLGVETSIFLARLCLAGDAAVEVAGDGIADDGGGRA